MRIGEFVSSLLWAAWKISTDVPLSASLNGKAMARRVLANSSFDRPATISLPST